MTTKFKKGTGNKPGLRCMHPLQAIVSVIGHTHRGQLSTATVKLADGMICEIPADWIGGQEAARIAYDEYRNEAMRQQRENDDRQRAQKAEILRLRMEAAANNGAA